MLWLMVVLMLTEVVSLMTGKWSPCHRPSSPSHAVTTATSSRHYVTTTIAADTGAASHHYVTSQHHQRSQQIRYHHRRRHGAATSHHYVTSQRHYVITTVGAADTVAASHHYITSLRHQNNKPHEDLLQSCNSPIERSTTAECLPLPLSCFATFSSCI